MRFLVLTLMMSFLSHSAFGAIESFTFVKLEGFADPEKYTQTQKFLSRHLSVDDREVSDASSIDEYTKALRSEVPSVRRQRSITPEVADWLLEGEIEDIQVQSKIIENAINSNIEKIVKRFGIEEEDISFKVKHVGEGNSRKVFLVESLGLKKLRCVIKIPRVFESETAEERDIIRSLDGLDCVPKIYEHNIDSLAPDQKEYLLMEYIDGFELQEILYTQ